MVTKIKNIKYSNKLNKLVKVSWLDACSNELELNIIDNAGPSGDGLLAINTSYGKLHKIYDNCIVIITEETTINTTLNITVIPKGWVVNIE